MFINNFCSGQKAHRFVKNVYSQTSIKGIYSNGFIWNIDKYHVFNICLLTNKKWEKAERQFINHLPERRIRKSLCAAGVSIEDINKIIGFLKEPEKPYLGEFAL